MIDTIQDLGITDDTTDEQLSSIIKEKIGITLIELKEFLSEQVKNRVEEIVLDLINIVPYGNYAKLIEDNNGMIEFIKTEAIKIDNWRLESIHLPKNEALIQFKFTNTAIDEGDTFEGSVYVSKSGKIRHAFAQGGI